MQTFFSSITDGTVTIDKYFICLAFAFICGLITALCSSFRSQSSKSFFISLLLLPAIVETVIIMVNGNVGTGVAVMGAFSLVRFRSVAGKARDIVSIFLAMTAGLACAAGYIAIALIFTVTVCAVMMSVSMIPFRQERLMELNITVPETLNFTGAFDDVFKKYTRSCRLTKTKTSNMGSLYKLYYKAEIYDHTKIREFLDELRCRNGNLEISIFEASEGSESL